MDKITERALGILADYIDRDCPFMDIGEWVYDDCDERYENRTCPGQSKCWVKFAIDDATSETNPKENP
jgi:hypothetical protein